MMHRRLREFQPHAYKKGQKVTRLVVDHYWKGLVEYNQRSFWKYVSNPVEEQTESGMYRVEAEDLRT